VAGDNEGGFKRGNFVQVGDPRAVPCITEDVGRTGGSARAKYTHQVQEYLAMLADLIDNPDRQVEEREAVLTLSVLVGAISMARAVEDPDLSQQILTNAAAALKERIPS
jgi:TetR/AcrR family transcriptional regulator, transcriptional repressor for nem operon